MNMTNQWTQLIYERDKAAYMINHERDNSVNVKLDEYDRVMNFAVLFQHDNIVQYEALRKSLKQIWIW